MEEPPKLSDVQQGDAKEVDKLGCDDKKYKKDLNLKTVITRERAADLFFKYALVVFICFMLVIQIKFSNEIVRGVANKEFYLDSTTIQIVVSGTIVEFILAIRVVIKSLFPANDRKESLDFMKYHTSNSINNNKNFESESENENSV